jgi:RNA polymerase-binding transcription factor DksA
MGDIRFCLTADLKEGLNCFGKSTDTSSTRDVDMKKAACTAEILGLTSKPRIPAQWAAHYRDLCVIRDELASIEAPKVETEKTDDAADAGSSEIDHNLELATHGATRETLGEVLAALRRIEQGTYGICELTGEAIEAERLEATPWARYSLAGQAEVEKTSGNTHARLSDRRSVVMVEESEVEADEPEDRAVAA